LADPADPFTDVLEFDGDDAGYDWWRNAHPDGFVLAVRARKPPMLHRAVCSDIDRDVHPKRLAAKGARQICADMKSALRAWVTREMPGDGKLLERCPKCGP
jgi:hypothetical protein